MNEQVYFVINIYHSFIHLSILSVYDPLLTTNQLWKYRQKNWKRSKEEEKDNDVMIEWVVFELEMSKNNSMIMLNNNSKNE